MAGETVTLTLSKEEAKMLWDFFASMSTTIYEEGAILPTLKPFRDQLGKAIRESDSGIH